MNDRDKIHTLLDELQTELAAGGTGSLVPLVTKATRLAHLVNQPEYAMLFELHLDGLQKAKENAGTRATPWPDSSRSPNWDPLQAFFQDRGTATGQVQGLGLPSLEMVAEEARGALDGVAGTDLAPLMQMKLEHTEILARIRNRVLAFANSVEKAIASVPGPPPPGNAMTSVFIGHGQSQQWLELKDFLESTLQLPVLEFNRSSPAGVPTSVHLDHMLSNAHFAFLVFTAEDRRDDGSLHARENVVHEAGLFQGRLGFRKAIILLEDVCEEFTNIQGLGQIRFRQGKLPSKFDEVRQVLVREGILGK